MKFVKPTSRCPIMQGRDKVLYIWTIWLAKPMDKTMPFINSLYLHIFVNRVDNRCGTCKKTKAFGLALLFHLQDRVAHFVRNPALPKDQPLRGRWWYSHSFLSNLAQKAWSFISNSHKRRGEFGIREIRFVSYRYAVVGDMAIRFYLILLKEHRLLSRTPIYK